MALKNPALLSAVTMFVKARKPRIKILHRVLSSPCDFISFPSNYLICVGDLRDTLFVKLDTFFETFQIIFHLDSRFVERIEFRFEALSIVLHSDNYAAEIVDQDGIFCHRS